MLGQAVNQLFLLFPLFPFIILFITGLRQGACPTLSHRVVHFKPVGFGCNQLFKRIHIQPMVPSNLYDLDSSCSKFSIVAWANT